MSLVVVASALPFRAGTIPSGCRRCRVADHCQPVSGEPARRVVRCGLWGALRVDGINGVRKGNKVFRVVMLDRIPMMVNRGHVPAVAVRAMNDGDFVDQEAAIEVLESILDTLRVYRDMDEENA